MKRASLIIVVFVAVGLAAGIVVLGCQGRDDASGPTPAVTAASSAPAATIATPVSAASNDSSDLPGMQTSEAPWAPQLSHLEERLQAIGLPALRREGTTLHLHQHLDLFIHGHPVPVPAEIGVNRVEGFIAPVHTHDGSGVIHIESSVVSRYTLGQFFDIWGVRLTPTCLGGYCNTGEQILRVYVNGAPVTSNPREIGLEESQEIVIAYGTAQELPTPIPSAFKAPS
jgi:hypothetical protein